MPREYYEKHLPIQKHLNLTTQHWRPLLAEMWKGQKTVTHARERHLYRKKGGIVYGYI